MKKRVFNKLLKLVYGKDNIPEEITHDDMMYIFEKAQEPPICYDKDIRRDYLMTFVREPYDEYILKISQIVYIPENEYDNIGIFTIGKEKFRGFLDRTGDDTPKDILSEINWEDNKSVLKGASSSGVIYYLKKFLEHYDSSYIVYSRHCKKMYDKENIVFEGWECHYEDAPECDYGGDQFLCPANHILFKYDTWIC